ncbi:MAG: NIPSNAP family protein [Actinomycetota bacterium]|nr:NIPSNAP family protein [Actinomycetota bacterium]
MILEIRTYKVLPGRLDEFVAAMAVAGPLLDQYGIDVVSSGPSVAADEGDHAYLMRAFSSIEERERQEEAFYGSDDWRNGPREAILAPIEGYHTVILDADASTVDALRR